MSKKPSLSDLYGKVVEISTPIAGVYYNADKSHLGGFIGVAMRDCNNDVDPNAIGIYKDDKLLGHIPADLLDEYYDRFGPDPYPCVGLIYSRDGSMRGHVKIIRATTADGLRETIKDYNDWIKEDFKNLPAIDEEDIRYASCRPRPASYSAQPRIAELVESSAKRFSTGKIVGLSLLSALIPLASLIIFIYGLVKFFDRKEKVTRFSSEPIYDDNGKIIDTEVIARKATVTATPEGRATNKWNGKVAMIIGVIGGMLFAFLQQAVKSA